MDEGDYYRGAVTEAAPGTVRQVAVSKGEKPDATVEDAGQTEGGEGTGKQVPSPDGAGTPAGTGAEA